MNLRTPLAAMVAAAALVLTSGCAVTRGQETTGAYIDDAAIKVDTLNGEVMLSGFAKNSVEKNTAESIAMKVKGVKSVKNQIVVRP